MKIRTRRGKYVALGLSIGAVGGFVSGYLIGSAICSDPSEFRYEFQSENPFIRDPARAILATISG